jgi:type II secretory pathway pseudopilin PulG
MHTLSRIRERVVGRWARSDAAGTARRTQGETGFILIIAIVIMAALLILIAAVASSAVDTNASASRSASSNQALAAADAGAQVGLFRLDTDGATGSSGSSMAHGATYQYSVATYGSTGASGSTACTGFSVVNSSDPVEQGCITSVGTVNGVNAQVQLRIA